MPSFSYVARDAGSGREVRNVVEAASEANAVAALLNRNLLVISIQERVSKKGRTAGGKVVLQDLVVFTRQLATMVDAGLAIVQSLQALAEQTNNKVMETVKKVLQLYREKYDGFNVRHYHEKLKEEHQIQLSYQWVKTALQTAGLVSQRTRRQRHRMMRERRSMAGMMLHCDGSTHA